MIKIDDIYKIDITDYMISEAKADAAFFKRNVGRKTHPVYDNRDLVGSIAHQAAEMVFDIEGVEFEGFRATKFELGQGDKGDIIYQNDIIDVKGTHSRFNKEWFYNKDFLIMQHQIDDGKFDDITHLLFVQVDFEAMIAYVYGIISKEDFMANAVPLRLKEDNLSIRARFLRPLRNYIYKI